MTNENNFLGTGWAFPPEFDDTTSETVMASNEDDIKQSLRILLSTSIGERVMQPKYGCNMKDYLYEPLNTSTQFLIREIVKDTILLYEPRVKLESLSLEADENEGKVLIYIDYRIIITNTRNNLVFPYYITEANLNI